MVGEDHWYYFTSILLSLVNRTIPISSRPNFDKSLLEFGAVCYINHKTLNGMS